jgi:hypothetical protein
MTGLDSNGPPWESGTHLHWAGKQLKVGDVVRLRVLDADKVDPPKSTQPGMTKAKLDAMKRKSNRYYLALYRKQRAQLYEQIAWIERDMKASRRSSGSSSPKRRSR